MFGIGKIHKKKIEIKRNRQVQEQDIFFNLASSLAAGIGKGMWGVMRKKKKRKKKNTYQASPQYQIANINTIPTKKEKQKKRLKQLSPFALALGVVGSVVFVKYYKK